MKPKCLNCGYDINIWEDDVIEIKQLRSDLEAAKAENAHLKEVSALYREPEKIVIAKLEKENAILNRMVEAMASFMRGDGLAENVIAEYRAEAEKAQGK